MDDLCISKIGKYLRPTSWMVIYSGKNDRMCEYVGQVAAPTEIEAAYKLWTTLDVSMIFIDYLLREVLNNHNFVEVNQKIKKMNWHNGQWNFTSYDEWNEIDRFYEFHLSPDFRQPELGELVDYLIQKNYITKQKLSEILDRDYEDVYCFFKIK